MTDRSYHVYVIQGPGRRDYADCQAALALLLVWNRKVITLDRQVHAGVWGAGVLLKLDNVIATPPAAYFSTAAVAQVPRRCGEEIARVLTGQRPLHVVNAEVYAPGVARRAR